MVDRISTESEKTQSVLDAEVNNLLADAADCELVEMYVRSNNQAAVEALIRRHAPMVAGVIRRVMPKSPDADDAFQATFLVLLKSARKIRKHASIAAWLYGVAYRTACRARLRLHEQKTVHIDSTALPSQDFRDPLTRISEQFQLELLDRELQQMSSPIKETLIDHHLLGYSASQIADRMEVSVSAVEGRLRRGRAALRHALSRRGVSFSVAVALSAKFQAACNAATSSPVDHLLKNDWFSNAIQNTSHVSVPKSLHSLASKDIATVTKALLPKFGLASAIAACSVAAISTPIMLTGSSGRSISSIMIGTASAEESQANAIALDAGGNAPQTDDPFGASAPTGSGAGFGSAVGGAADAGGLGGGSVAPFDAAPSRVRELAGGPAGAAPGGYGGSSGGGAPAGAGSYGGGYSGGVAGYGGAPGGYGGSGGMPSSGGSAAPGGYGSVPAGPAGYGLGGPGGPGMGAPGMPGGMGMGAGGPTGAGSMSEGSGSGAFPGGGGMGGGASSESHEYVNQGSKKPQWLTRGEETIDELEEARELIRTGLRKKITPEFNGVSLPNVLSQLSEFSNISIGTSFTDFDLAGITPEEPVTLANMSEVSIQRVLEIILGSLGDKLTYVVEQEGIQIVNKGSERAKQRRYYDLSYFISDEAAFFNVLRLFETTIDVDDVSSIGSILIITGDEPQHLKIEELLSQLARVPKENLLQEAGRD